MIIIFLVKHSNHIGNKHYFTISENGCVSSRIKRCNTILFLLLSPDTNLFGRALPQFAGDEEVVIGFFAKVAEAEYHANRHAD